MAPNMCLVCVYPERSSDINCTFWLFRTPVIRIMLTMANIVFKLCLPKSHQRVSLDKLWAIRKNWSSPEILDGYRKSLLNTMVSAKGVLAKIAIFWFWDILTIAIPVMRTVQTMANIVETIISDIAHTLYIIFTVLWNFSEGSLFCTF